MIEIKNLSTNMADMKHAMGNARGWYSEIEQLLADLQDDDKRDDAERQIREGPLSVMVRDGWRSPGGDNTAQAAEYEILLSTGGPALRIYGSLNGYGGPDSAELQAQDWGTPWTRVPDCSESVLLDYANQFYYGN